MLSPRLKGLTQTGSRGTKSWVTWGTQWWKRGGYRETENAGDGCGIMREFLEKCKKFMPCRSRIFTCSCVHIMNQSLGPVKGTSGGISYKGENF